MVCQAGFVAQLCASRPEALACPWSGAACGSLTTFQEARAAPCRPSTFCRCTRQLSDIFDFGGGGQQSKKTAGCAVKPSKHVLYGLGSQSDCKRWCATAQAGYAVIFLNRKHSIQPFTKGLPSGQILDCLTQVRAGLAKYFCCQTWGCGLCVLL